MSWLTDWLTDWLTERWNDLLVRFGHWLRLTDWLTDWLIDYEQSLFFLSPSSKMRENEHAHDWGRHPCFLHLVASPARRSALSHAHGLLKKRETARNLTDWLTDWLTDSLTDRLTNRPSDCLTYSLTDWLMTNWLTNDQLTDWLTG